jgi:hypothetical protein
MYIIIVPPEGLQNSETYSYSLLFLNCRQKHIMSNLVESNKSYYRYIVEFMTFLQLLDTTQLVMCTAGVQAAWWKFFRQSSQMTS